MKAIVYKEYGTPDVLKLQDVSQPVPKDDEVLVNVKAASINSWDWDMVRGEPFFVRLWGLWKPKYTIPGADIAGIVEAVGKNVTKFKPGDEVFGDLCESGWGGFADYACAKETALEIKPLSISFEHAATLPQAGLMALQSVIQMAKLSAGQTILINGAGGGVGTFAVQLAKMIGAEVTAVDSFEKLAMLKSLGAHHVIDYTVEDFTANGKRYDVIIDVVANRSLQRYKRSLNANGIFIMIGGTPSSILHAMLFKRWVSTGGKRLGMLAYKPNDGLATIAELYTKRVIVPVIDKQYDLSRTPEAFHYFSKGHFKGKIIIKI